MKEIAAVVFDWAGTVVDFGCLAPVRALQAAFAAEGVGLSEAQARKDMGRAKRDHVTAILADTQVSANWMDKFGRAPTTADGDRVYAALEPLMQSEAAHHSTLIPGAADLFAWLKSEGIKIGSSTGYTRTMMADIIMRAAHQGYAPSVVVCAGETLVGRPSPLPMWKALVELGAYPAWRSVKVDDATVGIEEGNAAGAWTVGVSDSGNGVGLSLEEWNALGERAQAARREDSTRALRDAGANYVVPSVTALKDTIEAIARRIAKGERPPTR
jgi:phosphonoacetaldehyde hydrolase